MKTFHGAPLALRTLALVSALAAGAAAPALAQPAPNQTPVPAANTKSGDSCFNITERESMIAVNDHSVLIRSQGRVYLVTTNRCPALGRPDPRITVIMDGSSYVCGRLDYRLQVGEIGIPGSSLPCLVQSQRQLSPAEIAALPKNLRP